MAQEPQIPFLPGNTFVDPRKTDHRKQQTLGFRAGMPISVAEPLATGSQPHAATMMRATQAPAAAALDPEIDFTLTYGTRSSALQTQTTSAQRPVPAHIALDKKVLAFAAFFTETENPTTGSRRVRFVRIAHFLADDTTSVWEERQPNSGIDGGMRVRRQRIEGINEQSFEVGKDVTIYGTSYHIYDADAFTRAYCREAGRELKPAEPRPADEQRQKREAIDRPRRTQQQAPREHQLARFLEMQGTVLRFSCVWDARGQPHAAAAARGQQFVLAFHLVDNTVEIHEVRKPNDGLGPFSLFLKRTRLPKPGSATGEFITDKDLGIGVRINVLGRDFVLLDADKFTRDWYAKHHGKTEWPKVELEPDEDGTPRSAPPMPRPETFSQMGKPSPMANRKALENQGKMLRFRATVITDREEYQGRLFGVAFWLADDAVSVAEFANPEATRGQRFLERGKYKNPVRKGKARSEWEENFQAADFFVGATIEVSGWRFRLDGADEWTLEWMESNPHEFPYSNLDAVMAKVASKLRSSGQSADDLKAAFTSTDQAQEGAVSEQQFRDVLPECGLVEQEMITLARRFALPEGGKIAFSDFCSMLAAYM